MPENPATGILLRRSYGDAVIYRVICECGQTDHDHEVWVEAEESDITVTTYTTQKTNFWSLTRWQLIWTLLTQGWVKYEASLTMNRQQALNYATILQQAVTDVEQFRKTQ